MNWKYRKNGKPDSLNVRLQVSKPIGDIWNCWNEQLSCMKLDEIVAVGSVDKNFFKKIASLLLFILLCPLS